MTRPVNVYGNLRARILIMLVAAFNTESCDAIDVAAVDALLGALPLELSERIWAQISACLTTYRNFKVFGKKMSCTTLSRRLSRLEFTLTDAEEITDTLYYAKLACRPTNALRDESDPK